MSTQLIEMKCITKTFPGVKALDCVDFSAVEGEVHVLLGENGAGKSTLSKVLAGVYAPDSGEIRIGGELYQPEDIRYARSRGIAMIFQELQLVSQLSVAENIFLGREIIGKYGIDFKAMRKKSAEMLALLKVDINPSELVRHLSVAQMQMVEIIKAITFESKILIMDEPTASLTDREVVELFRIIHDLKKKGICIIYISHRMQEFFEIGDRVTVMRDGAFIDTVKVKDVTIEKLIHLMVGRELTEQYPRERVDIGDEILRVDHLCQKKNRLKDISFTARKGEILGFSGLVGAGRTELMKAIFGADSFEQGSLYLKGKKVLIRNPADAVKLGIAYLSEDRKHEGLNLIMGVDQNITLASLKNIIHKGKLDLKQEKIRVVKAIKALRVKTHDPGERAKNLSGGNQQKVVIAKWLETNPDILIFDEPTRGIDVGAKVEIYKIMNQLVKDGACVIMVSSDLPEILGMSDRIIVMSEGRITGSLNYKEADQEKIMKLATKGAECEIDQ